MAAASDKTDHVWRRRGCTEIGSGGRGGEGEEERRAKVAGKTREGGEGKHEMETQWDAAAEDKGREAAAAAAVFP